MHMDPVVTRLEKQQIRQQQAMCRPRPDTAAGEQGKQQDPEFGKPHKVRARIGASLFVFQITVELVPYEHKFCARQEAGVRAFDTLARDRGHGTPGNRRCPVELFEVGMEAVQCFRNFRAH